MRFGLRPLRSLRARIAVAAGASILAAVALFAVVTVLLVNHELRASLDTALRQRAQEVAQLAVSTPAVLTDPGALESPVSGRQISVQVLDRRGRIVARSLNLGAEVLPEDALERAARVQGRTGAEDVELGGRPLRIYAAPIADAGRARGGRGGARRLRHLRHRPHDLPPRGAGGAERRRGRAAGGAGRGRAHAPRAAAAARAGRRRRGDRAHRRPGPPAAGGRDAG